MTTLQGRWMARFITAIVLFLLVSPAETAAQASPQNASDPAVVPPASDTVALTAATAAPPPNEPLGDGDDSPIMEQAPAAETPASQMTGPVMGDPDESKIAAVLDELLIPPEPAVLAASMPHRRVCDATINRPSHYFVADAIFLQRDNGTNNAVITEDNGGGSGSSTPLFTTRDMRFTIGPGTRLFYGTRECSGDGWEIGYLGVYGMYGDADANATDLLAVPGPLGLAVPGWSNADTIRPNYSSNLNMVELNAFSSRSEIRGNRWAAAPWQRICHRHDSEWLAGFRWAGLDETASLNVIVAPGDPQTSYRVATTSQFFAPQVGWRGRATWDRWMLEGWAKTALAGTLLQSNAAPITSSLVPGAAYRPPRKNSTTGVGFIGDINLSGVYRFNETWGFRCGYTLMWLTGTALAGNQFDFTDTADSGRQLFGEGTVFLQGGSIGVEARW